MCRGRGRRTPRSSRQRRKCQRRSRACKPPWRTCGTSRPAQHHLTRRCCLCHRFRLLRPLTRRCLRKKKIKSHRGQVSESDPKRNVKSTGAEAARSDRRRRWVGGRRQRSCPWPRTAGRSGGWSRRTWWPADLSPWPPAWCGKREIVRPAVCRCERTGGRLAETAVAYRDGSGGLGVVEGGVPTAGHHLRRPTADGGDGAVLRGEQGWGVRPAAWRRRRGERMVYAGSGCGFRFSLDCTRPGPLGALCLREPCRRGRLLMGDGSAHRRVAVSVLLI